MLTEVVLAGLHVVIDQADMLLYTTCMRDMTALLHVVLIKYDTNKVVCVESISHHNVNTTTAAKAFLDKGHTGSTGNNNYLRQGG